SGRAQTSVPRRPSRTNSPVSKKQSARSACARSGFTVHCRSTTAPITNPTAATGGWVLQDRCSISIPSAGACWRRDASPTRACAPRATSLRADDPALAGGRARRNAVTRLPRRPRSLHCADRGVEQVARAVRDQRSLHRRRRAQSDVERRPFLERRHDALAHAATRRRLIAPRIALVGVADAELF